MTPETLEWLSIKVPGFTNLSAEERDAIDDFSFLWSLFEGKVMSKRCDLLRIRNYVQQLEDQGRLEKLDLEQYVGYLRNRYFKDGDVTEHFYGLNLNVHNNVEEVLVLLKNEEAPKTVKLIGCLIIIYRLRNNLFHGEKWQYNLEGQLDNFTQANLFLKSLMHGDMNV